VSTAVRQSIAGLEGGGAAGRVERFDGKAEPGRALPQWGAAEPRETVEQVRHRLTKDFLLCVLGKESKKMVSKREAQFVEVNIANDETALFK
jgi:hypothetical protein